MSQQALSEAYHNNTAASIIEDGKYSDAIASLSNSIMRFPGCAGRSCEEIRRSGSCCERCDGTHVLSLDQCMLYNHENFKEDGAPYLYKSPIRIPNESNMTCGKKKQGIISAVMVFNLALSHHLQSLEYITPKDREVHLEKAIMLYELAFDIQRKENCDSNYIFVLAIMNNLSTIHRIQNNKALANEGFRHMLSILMYLVDSGKNVYCGRLEGFHYNVLSLSTSSLTRKVTGGNVAGAA